MFQFQGISLNLLVMPGSCCTLPPWLSVGDSGALLNAFVNLANPTRILGVVAPPGLCTDYPKIEAMRRLAGEQFNARNIA